MTKFKALRHFAHGALNVSRGEEVELPEGAATDLVKLGFVEEAGRKKAPVPSNKMAPVAANKAAGK